MIHGILTESPPQWVFWCFVLLLKDPEMGTRGSRSSGLDSLGIALNGENLVTMPLTWIFVCVKASDTSAYVLAYFPGLSVFPTGLSVFWGGDHQGGLSAFAACGCVGTEGSGGLVGQGNRLMEVYNLECVFLVM